MKEAADFLRKISGEGRRVLVLCHQNADTDAVASATVLTEVLTELGANASAGAADDVSALAKTVLNSFGKNMSEKPELDSFEVAVMVDTSSPGHLGKFGEKLKEFSGKIAVIDHHRPVEEMKKMVELHFVRADITSESELIFRIMSELGKNPSAEQASLLLAGVMSDTGHLRLAKPETFGAVASLIAAGADYERVMDVLKQPEEPSKRIAMLKAAGRSELHRIHDKLIVFSELGSFEGDASGMFIRIGADAAFVGSEDKGKVRLSGRTRTEFTEKTGVHLGELMEDLAKNFGGSGGGHPGAASMNGQGKLKDLKKQLFKILQQKLKPGE
jgi:nanoRNase/pAp phosphatase (c-di-AMP/oligoRNAs hydrolase)